MTNALVILNCVLLCFDREGSLPYKIGICRDIQISGKCLLILDYYHKINKHILDCSKLITYIVLNFKKYIEFVWVLFNFIVKL